MSEDDNPPPPPPLPTLDFSTTLPNDVLHKVLSHLPTEALPPAAAVCKRWRRVISDPTKPVWRETFERKWQLAHVSGAPKSLAFCAKARVSNSFVTEHAVERNDSVASIAVRHGLGLMEAGTPRRGGRGHHSLLVYN